MNSGKQVSLRSRILAIIIFVIIAFSIMSTVVFMVTFYSLDQYNSELNNIFNYETLSHDISQAYLSFNNYIQLNSNDNLNDYLENLNKTKQDINVIKKTIGKSDTDMYYLLINVEEIIKTYEEQNLEIINLLPDNSVFQIYTKITNSQTLYEYAITEISSLLDKQTLLLQNKISEVSTSVNFIMLTTFLLIIGLFVFIIILAINLSKNLTRPIEQLTDYAKEISKGNFDVDNKVAFTTSEIETLSNTLDYTKHEIKDMITELQDKADLETRLHVAEIDNLRISNDLKNTEIRMLQSQINPHFLFNTLNSIGRIAYSNGDTDVENLIYSLSDMLRYNLSSMDTHITIKQEIENLERYLLIQQTRFKNKLTTNITINTDNMAMPMPALILQPLVENSIEHGLKPYDYNGTISVDVSDGPNDTVIVTISDSGIGIDEKILQDILNDEYNQKADKHSGIGLTNVIKRMRAFFGDDNCIVITSIPGEGATIKLKLKSVEHNEVQDLNM